MSDAEKCAFNRVGLDPRKDQRLPEWAVSLILAKGVSNRNKLFALLSHNRRIQVYIDNGNRG